VDGTEDQHVKQNKSDSEKVLHILSPMKKERQTYK
jgi:hypothetical protein